MAWERMAHEPIERIDIEGYGCIRKASIALSPIHAFIGPNDSGKSTILRAVRTVAQFAAGTFADADVPFDPMLTTEHGLAPGPDITIVYGDGLQYTVATSQYGLKESIRGPAGRSESPLTRSWSQPSFFYTNGFAEPFNDYARRLRDRATLPTMVRFDPDALRVATQLIADRQGISFINERGEGLASVFDAILNRDADAFRTIQEKLRILFPSIAKIGLINVSTSQKEIAVTLANDGPRIGAKAMSEGLLYYLAFAALQHVDGSRLLLVEEPENGLHPARVAEVMRILREFSTHGQVLIATHSPLVVNELEGHEVSVVTRTPENGTRTTLLKDVPGYEDAAKVYRPGEFWVSYCDGDREEPLLTGAPRS